MKSSTGEIAFDNLKHFWQNFVSIFTCNFAKSHLNGYFPMKLQLVRKSNKPMSAQVK